MDTGNDDAFKLEAVPKVLDGKGTGTLHDF